MHLMNTRAWCQVISYKDHFVQGPFRTKETISFGTITQKSLRTRIFLYEVGPEFLHTHVNESFRTRNSKFLFFYMQWSPFYKMVFVPNGLCTK